MTVLVARNLMLFLPAAGATAEQSITNLYWIQLLVGWDMHLQWQ